MVPYLRQYWPDYPDNFNKYSWETWYDIPFILFNKKYQFDIHDQLMGWCVKRQDCKIMMSAIIYYSNNAYVPSDLITLW